jgi:hypothetical protein
MNGFGAVVASACLKTLAGLLAVTAGLALVLAMMQWLRGEPAQQVAVLALVCGGGGGACWWLGGVFSGLARKS